MTAWLSLLAAIVLEVIGTSLLKESSDFEKPMIGLAAIGFYTASLVFLAPALKAIPVGIAYAIWAGVGIVAVTLVGLVAFNQRLELTQYVFIGLILIGAVGLRLTTEG